MADEKDLTKQEIIESGKKDSKAESKNDGESRGIGEWFAGIRSEFKKIIWPNRKELANHTMTVIITSAIIAACVVVMDQVFDLGYSQLLQFASRFVE